MTHPQTVADDLGEGRSRWAIFHRYAEEVIFTSRGRQVLILAFAMVAWANTHDLLVNGVATPREAPAAGLSGTLDTMLMTLLFVTTYLLAMAILYAMDVYKDEHGLSEEVTDASD